MYTHMYTHMPVEFLANYLGRYVVGGPLTYISEALADR